MEYALSDQVCQWLTADRWFSSDTLVFSTNKTDRHYMIKRGGKHHNPNPNPQISILDYWSWVQYSLHIKHNLQGTSNELFISHLLMKSPALIHVACKMH